MYSLYPIDDDNSPLIEINVRIDAVHLDDNKEGLPLIDTLEKIHSRYVDTCEVHNTYVVIIKCIIDTLYSHNVHVLVRS